MMQASIVQLFIRPVGGDAQKRGSNTGAQPEQTHLCERCETRHRFGPLPFYFLDSIQPRSTRVHMNKTAK